jgi:hypothetical protein
MAFGGVTKFPTPAAGGGGGGATFTVEWDCTDAAALATADWKTTDPQTVNGVSMSSHNDSGTDVCELDGSTGLVMRTTDGHRSLPYNNAYPATMLLADIEDSVGGSWDRYTERCFFQARLNGTTASPQGAGLCMAESLTPLDIDQIFYGTANGSLQYQSEGTVARSNSITVPSDILMEIILGQWGMVRWRMVAWPGSFPDPDTFTPLGVTNGYTIEGSGSPVKTLAATKWVPGSAAWGFCVWHNSAAAGQFTQTVKGWRCGKITVPT